MAWWDDAFKAVGNFVNDVGKNVAKFVEPAMPVISNLVSSTVKSIPGVGPLVGTAIDVVAKVVGGSGSGESASVKVAGPAPAPTYVPPKTAPSAASPTPSIASGNWRPTYNGITDTIRVS